MKYLFILFTLFTMTKESAHEFTLRALNSEEQLKLSEFKGKKVLIVNVASKCGYTPQYKELQELYETYNNQLVVLGLPCDQFMGQELDTESEIAQFCSSRFDVTFPMTEMIEVKGKNQHPLYGWLTSKDQNGKGDYKVSWNFNKFLIDENGQLLEYFSSNVKPMDEKIIRYLK